jgi:HEAT repeat protein
MHIDEAIERCVYIARIDGHYQSRGAIMCLARFGADAIDDLNDLAFEGYPYAMEALRKIDDPNAAKVIEYHTLHNKRRLVRLFAVGHLPVKPQFIPSLIEILYDPDEDVRWRAAFALKCISYRRSEYDQMLEQAMLTATKHPDQTVREYATSVLQIIGSKANPENAPDAPPFRKVR